MAELCERDTPSLGASRAFTVVTWRSPMPHGVMSWKGCRSLATLMARPWYVTQRCALTPIAATFVFSTHTPVSPGILSPLIPDTSSRHLQDVIGYELC